MRLIFLFVLASVLLFGCLGLEKYFIFEKVPPKVGPGGLIQPTPSNITVDDAPPKLPDEPANTTINVTTTTNLTNVTGPKVYTNESPPVPHSAGGGPGGTSYTPPAPSTEDLPPLPE